MHHASARAVGLLFSRCSAASRLDDGEQEGGVCHLVVDEGDDRPWQKKRERFLLGRLVDSRLSQDD